MEELRVPKRTATVEVALFGGDERRLEVFLAESSPHHAGPERISDLFRNEEAFVPAFDPRTGRVSWLNTANVVSVRTQAKLDDDETGDALPTEYEVEVVLSTGVRLRALIGYVRPDEQARLTDYLNDGRPFFRLLDGDSLVFVNKRHVVCVTAEG